MIVGKGTETPYIRSYQKKDVVEKQQNIGFEILKQLPKGFKLMEGALYVAVTFVFPVLKSMSKKERDLIESGEIVYKTAKPDLVDNLMKGLFDAMNGIVFKDDAQICRVSSKKIFGEFGLTVVEIGKIE